MESIICHFFIFLVEAVILWQYTFNLFTDKCSPRRKITALSALYFILFAASFSGSKWLNVALYLVINFIFLTVWCCPGWYSAFFHSSILTAVMILCELMVYYIITYFSPLFFAGEDIHNLAVFATLSKLIFFIIVYILSHFFKVRQDSGGPCDISVSLLTLVPVTSVFVMLTFIKISDSCPIPSALHGMVTLSAAFLLASNLLVFGISQYNQRKHAEFTQMQILLQKESDSVQYYEMLLSQNENQSILIHDIKKHLQSIDTLNNQNKPDKIRTYIHQLMNSSDLTEMSRLCSHEMLNAILSRYQRCCTDKHIVFHADIRNDTPNGISDADLTALFCNLLDNAVEAAAGIPDSFIEISMYKREKTPFTVITVINSSRKNPFSGQSGIPSTTKPQPYKHGFGIKSIRKITAKYHGDLQMHYNQDTLTFHTVITLKL